MIHRGHETARPQKHEGIGTWKEKGRENRQRNIEYEEDPVNKVVKHFVCSLDKVQLPCGPAVKKNSVYTPAQGTWPMAQPESCFTSMLLAMTGKRQSFAWVPASPGQEHVPEEVGS